MKKYCIDYSNGLKIFESDNGVPYDELIEQAKENKLLSEIDKARLKKFIKNNRPNLLDIGPEIEKFNKAPRIDLSGVDEEESLRIFQLDNGNYMFFLEQTYPEIDKDGNDFPSHNRTVIELNQENVKLLVKFLT